MLSVCLLTLFLLVPFVSTINTQTRRLHLLAPSLLASCLLAFMPIAQAQVDLLSDDIPVLSSDNASEKSSDLTPELKQELKQELHPSLDSVLKPLIPENALTPTLSLIHI